MILLLVHGYSTLNQMLANSSKLLSGVDLTILNQSSEMFGRLDIPGQDKAHSKYEIA